MSLASRDHSDNGERELSDVKQEYSISSEDVIGKVMRQIAEKGIITPLEQAEKVREVLSGVGELDERANEFLRRANAYLEAHNAIKEINSALEPKDETRSIDDLRLFFANPDNHEKYGKQAKDFLQDSRKFTEAETKFKASYAEYLTRPIDISEQSKASSEEVSRPRFHSASSSIPLPTASYSANIESSKGKTALQLARKDSESKTPTPPHSPGGSSGPTV